MSHPKPKLWSNEIGAIKRNYDYGEGPFSGVPGGGETSMGDFLKKRRKRKIKKLEELSIIFEGLTKCGN